MVFLIEQKIKRALKKPTASSSPPTKPRDPVLISKKTKEDVKIGDCIHVECTADLRTRIQWFREEEPLVTDELCGIIITESIRIEADRKYRCSLLTVEDVEETDSGLYWCKNAADPADSDRVRINVVRAVTVEPSLWVTGSTTIPKQTSTPKTARAKIPGPMGNDGNQTLVKGDMLNLRATGPGGSALRWYRGDDEVSDDELAGVHIAEKYDTRTKTKCSSLTIARAGEQHSDVYTCINADNESILLLAIIKVKAKK